MLTQMTTIRVLDPTAEAVAFGAVMAPRPTDLKGKAVGLLAIGKPNADRFLAAVADLLTTDSGVRAVLARDKKNPSRPAPSQMLDELARECDVVVVGVGD